jgi:hypothetical protein
MVKVEAVPEMLQNLLGQSDTSVQSRSPRFLRPSLPPLPGNNDKILLLLVSMKA